MGCSALLAIGEVETQSQNVDRLGSDFGGCLEFVRGREAWGKKWGVMKKKMQVDFWRCENTVIIWYNIMRWFEIIFDNVTFIALTSFVLRFFVGGSFSQSEL